MGYLLWFFIYDLRFWPSGLPASLYHVLRTWYPSGRFERLDFRGERENQMRHGIMSALQTLYHGLRTWYPSGRFERLDFRGERENQMRDGIMSALQTLYHVLQTWYPSGGIGRLVFCGERRNQMRDGIMSVLQTLYHRQLRIGMYTDRFFLLSSRSPGLFRVWRIHFSPFIIE